MQQYFIGATYLLRSTMYVIIFATRVLCTPPVHLLQVVVLSRSDEDVLIDFEYQNVP